MKNASTNPQPISSENAGCGVVIICIVAISITVILGWMEYPVLNLIICMIAGLLCVGLVAATDPKALKADDKSGDNKPSPMLDPKPKSVPDSHRRTMRDIGPAEFALLQSEVYRLYDFVERACERKDVRERLDKVMNISNEDDTPWDFGLKKQMTILVDVKRAYDGLGHGYPSDDPESIGLTLFAAYYIDNQRTKWEYKDRFLVKDLQPSLSSYLKNVDILISKSPFGENVFFFQYILGLCDEDLSMQYTTLLYRFASATAKADGTVTPQEAKWLATIAHQNPAIDASEMEAYISDSTEKEDKLAPRSVSAVDEKKAEEELRELIGLQSVKDDVMRLTNFVRIQQERAHLGMKTTSVSYHCVFTGNPGTGKTTVARIVARIYKELGILKKGQLIETDRSGLVAEYVGQTAVKTNKVIDSALDGVLFIDEAYSLVQGGKEDYGMEAIATLLKRMEDDRERLIVILAGYEGEMHTFIQANPGLQSRFNRYIHFDDYSAEELKKIFLLNVKKLDYKLTDAALDKLNQVLSTAVATKDENFGNARFVRNLFERTLENQATRLSTVTSLTKEKLSEITEEDISIAK